jgi:dUTP pyrophosphatase
MKIKYKKMHMAAQALKQAHVGDACFDLSAVSYEYSDKGEAAFHEYGTGLALEIPQGHVGLVFPRSSVSNTGAILCNSVGVIDAGYRGEVKVRYKAAKAPYKVGERVGQLMILPLPSVEFEESESLEESVRGAGGFGSTGK